MNKRSAVLIIVFFSIILSFPWIGSRAFYTRGEPREALVPQKMIESSNWILPRTFDNRVPSKPPFSHWLIGLSAHLKGALTGEVVVDRWSARFPSALLALLFIVLFFYWVESSLGVERAFHTSCILLTSFEWMRGLVTTRVDTVLSVLLGTAFLCLYSLTDRRTVLRVIGPILALAAATLTKGPVALVLPAAIIAIYLFAEKRQIFRSFQIGVQVFLPALLVASFWYVLAYREAGSDFLNKFWYENVQRFASSTDDQPHDHSVFYLLGMFFVGLVPWSFFVFARLKISACKTLGLKSIKNWLQGLAPIERYSLTAVAVIFVFFSIPASKRGVYLLPAFPFAALLLSRVTTQKGLFETLCVQKFAKIAALILGLVVTGITLVLAIIPLSGIKDPLLRDLMSFEQHVFRSDFSAWLAFCLVIYSLVRLWQKATASSSLFVPLVTVLVSVLVFFQGPIVNGFAAAVSEDRLSEQLKGLPPEMPIYSYYFEYYGTIFNLHRSVSLLGWNTAPSGVILVKKRDFERFKTEIGEGATLEVIGESQGSVVQYRNQVLIVKFQQAVS